MDLTLGEASAPLHCALQIPAFLVGVCAMSVHRACRPPLARILTRVVAILARCHGVDSGDPKAFRDYVVGELTSLCDLDNYKSVEHEQLFATPGAWCASIFQHLFRICQSAKRQGVGVISGERRQGSKRDAGCGQERPTCLLSPPRLDHSSRHILQVVLLV